MKKPLPTIALIAVLFIISCQSSSSDKETYTSGSATISEPIKEKTVEEIKEELAQKERQNPGEYLKATVRFRENLIGETVLEGRIDNTATMANFKDIVIEATFLAASSTVLGTKEFTRYELVGHGYGVTFKHKTIAPDQTKPVAVRVINATPVE